MSAPSVAESSVAHGSFVIERSYPATPEKVFAAFADPVKKRRWYAEANNRDVVAFEMDFRVGGVERGRYRFKEGTPFLGVILTNQTTYQDIEPNRRIVVAYTMAVGERRISASLATFELIPSGAGTRLIFTEQSAFFEGSDGAKMRETGWNMLLDSLSKEMAL